MADQELRERERRAQAADDPASRLAAAAALERAGRRDEAFAALWPARKDPAVRAALSRFPAWTHVDGDAGRTRSIDMPVPRGVPRVRWSVQLQAHASSFLVGPGGIAPVGEETTTTVLLDPDDGSRGLASQARAIAWDGERRVVEQCGKLRWIAPDGGVVATIPDVRQACVRDGLALVQGGVVDDLSAWRLEQDRPVRLWSRRLTGPDFLRTMLLAGELALVDLEERLVALEAETGRERFAIRAGCGPTRLDARGALTGGQRDPVTASGPGGAIGWRGCPGEVLAMDSESVVVGRTREVELLARASGESRGRFPSVGRGGGVTLARDALLLWSNGRPAAGTPCEALRPPFLAAFGPAGEPLWAFDREWFAGELPCAVVPWAGRVYIATVGERIEQVEGGFVTRRRVLCMESGGA